jgi:hypothetical protein
MKKKRRRRRSKRRRRWIWKNGETKSRMKWWWMKADDSWFTEVFLLSLSYRKESNVIGWCSHQIFLKLFSDFSQIGNQSLHPFLSSLQLQPILTCRKEQKLNFWKLIQESELILWGNISVLVFIGTYRAVNLSSEKIRESEGKRN